MTVLTQSLNSTLSDDGYTTENIEKVRVNAEDNVVVLYSMYGDWEWRKQAENMQALQEFARTNEAKSLRNTSKVKTDEGDVSLIDVEAEQQEEPEAIDEEQEPAETIQEESAFQGKSNSDIQEETAEEKPKRTANVKRLMILAVLIAAAVALILSKKHKE